MKHLWFALLFTSVSAVLAQSYQQKPLLISQLTATPRADVFSTQLNLQGGKFTANNFYWAVGVFASSSQPKNKSLSAYQRFGPTLEIGKYIPLGQRLGLLPSVSLQSAVTFSLYTGFYTTISASPLRVSYAVAPKWQLVGQLGQMNYYINRYNKATTTSFKPFETAVGVGLLRHFK